MSRIINQRSRKEELLFIIRSHDNLYYNEDTQVISDPAYDELVKEYLSLGGSLDDIAKGEASPDLPKVKHPYPVKSLDKIHTREEVVEALIRLAPGVIQPKLDGITMITYGTETINDASNDKPIWATKGDGGEEGENVSNTASKVPNLLAIHRVAYRSEVFMPIPMFRAINEKRIEAGLKLFKNPRNAAAGMIRHKTADKVEGLHYMAYNIMGSTLSETDQLLLLKEKGITIVPSASYTIDNVEEMADYIMSYNEEQRYKLDYEVDGLVIKSDIPNSRVIFGETGHHYKNAAAFKFETTGGWTKLKEVVWSIGRTGQVTPVAIFEPIEILGSSVERATLSNYDGIVKLGLTNDCFVYVVKANDIIPKILKVKDAIGDIIPRPVAVCQTCGEGTVIMGANIYCLNPLCEANIIAKTNHFARKDALNISGLSIETIRKMFKRGMLENEYSLFNITYEDILDLDGFAEKSATTLYNKIQKSKKAPLNKFLYAASVPLVGRTVSKDIAEKLGSYDNVMNDIADGCPQIKEIDGVGKEIVASLIAHSKLFGDLWNYVTPTNVLKKEKIEPIGEQLSFVFTGSFTNPQGYYEDLAKSAGHKVSSAVSSSTSYLVNNDINSTSSKNAKAKELGKPIISEDEFTKLIKGDV